MATPRSTPSKASLRKAAILVSTLDRAAADALLDKMGPSQAELVRNAIRDLGDISPAEQSRVVSEFIQAGGLASLRTDEGIELDDSLARRLRTSAARGEAAGNHGTAEADPPPFRFLHEANADALARHLEREHPQIVAVVVAHLPPKQAAELVKRLPDRLQAEVLRRVAEMDAADPAVVRELERQLELLFSDEIRAARNRRAGLAAVAAILVAAGRDRDEIMKHVSQHDRDLGSLLLANPRHGEEASDGRLPQHPGAARVSPAPAGCTAAGRAELPQPQETRRRGPRDDRPPSALAPGPAAEPQEIAFDDLAQLDDGGLATVLRAADPQVILLALAGANEALVQRILRQLPAREARSLQRRLRDLGPLRLADVEHAQRCIGQLAAQLATRGLIQLRDGGRFAVAV